MIGYIDLGSQDAAVGGRLVHAVVDFELVVGGVRSKVRCIGCCKGEGSLSHYFVNSVRDTYKGGITVAGRRRRGAWAYLGSARAE